MPGKPFLLLLILFTFVGCSMKKYCADRYPPTPLVRDSISYIENTIVRDTTVFVPIPFEQVKDSVDIDTVSGFTYSTLTTSFAWSYASIINGKLYHYLQQKDTLIEARIRDAIKQHSKVEYKEKFTEVLVPVNNLTQFQIVQIWAAWILLFILLGTIAFKKFVKPVQWVLSFLRKKKPP